MQPEMRELSDKISGVELKMTEKLGDILAEMRGMNATAVATFDRMKEVQVDMEKVKETSTKAMDSTNSAHKRLDSQASELKEVEANIKPLVESDLLNRVKGIETNIRWVAITVIGAVILALMSLIFKGG